MVSVASFVNDVVVAEVVAVVVAADIGVTIHRTVVDGVVCFLLTDCTH